MQSKCRTLSLGSSCLLMLHHQYYPYHETSAELDKETLAVEMVVSACEAYGDKHASKKMLVCRTQLRKTPLMC